MDPELNPVPGAGRYTPATPDAPDLLYDRDVRTRVRLIAADRMLVTAHLHDDTNGPTGFATVHDMTIEAVVSVPDLEILSVSSAMANHPHGTCPMTLLQLDALVGMRIAGGYMGQVRRMFGSNRGCNHLHALAQQIGTVSALTFASRLAHDDPSMQELPAPQWYRRVVDREPRVVNSCVIWHEDGDLYRRLTELES